MTYTFDEKTVSDLHKDAFGHRPSEYWWNWWNAQNDEGKQREWDSLISAMEASMDEDRATEARMLELFEARICDTLNLGAKDEETAIGWLLEAEGFKGNDYCYGADYAAYHFGLSYTNPYKEIFTRVMTARTKLEV